jgi:hypothetical protein
MDPGYPFGAKRAESPATAKSAHEGGVVVVYPGKESDPHGHETMTHSALARKLAALKRLDFAGPFDSRYQYDCPLYFVPSETLGTIEHAHGLGIRGEQDLFGGVVPFPFVATKTITHPLPAPNSRAPDGWCAGFAQAVHDVVLPGFSAFAPDDVRNASMQLLKAGAVRLKKASGIGGLGQSVIANENELEAYIQSLDLQELSRDGLVAEQNLGNVVTHSVGQVRVGKLLATYYGTQQLTVSNSGAEVYGGSRLIVMRGDFDALLRIEHTREVRTAIEQAGTYHTAALASFPGMFASRCNYDIAQGVDDGGRWHSGVLEQSWRIGGASAAEIAALEAFQADPALDSVCASTTEVYGANPSVPRDADVYFQGTDEQIGALTKYSRLEAYANA